MEKSKILVVEDVNSIEIDVRNRLEEMGYKVQSIVLSAEKAYEAIENEKPDLVLMDVILDGDKDGIETAKEIREHYNIPVLFLSGETNHEKLAGIAESKAYGFVSKPFKQADLMTNIQIALQRHEEEQEQLYEIKKLKRSNTSHDSPQHDFIFVRADYKLNKINLQDILFIEALKDYVVINTKDKIFTTHATMKKMMQVLPEKDFARVHRSYIVRLDKVFSVKYPDLVIEGKMKAIPIGGLYRKELFKRLNVV